MKHQRAVGYHVDVGCSGTLISNDLFLSAGHCRYAVGHRVRFNYQNAPDGTARGTTDFTVASVVEQENGNGWDYAIVRLNNSPGATFGYASIGTFDPAAGRQVVIMGHPAGVPKVIHAGPVLDYSSSNWFRHQVDTVGGSSGSGVLTTAGQLVGIHTNAGCNTTGSIEGNSALRMSQLVGHSPTLRGLLRGALLLSDRSTGLAVNAWGGAQHGTVLRLSNACTTNNPDCTWTYKDGMLLSDRDRGLAINAWGGAAHGGTLRLHNGCSPSNPDCTWTLKNGVFYSDRNPALAINASGGAANGTELKLYNGCPATNPDCTWTYKGAMSFSDNGDKLAMNAWGGAAVGNYVRLNNGCDAGNPDCTWTIRRGMISSDRDASMFLNAWGGAQQGTYVRLHNGCVQSNPDCTWTLNRGRILSDANAELGVNAWGSAQQGTYLRLWNGCPASNPDCTFTGTDR
jgi:hypothetical protein